MTQIYVGDLFMDTVHADIIFVVDKKEIPGHRLVLAKTCDYFEKLLFGNFLESKSKKVEISGVSAKVFEEVMRFTYKGQLEVEEWTIQDLLSLLAVAHEYQFQQLFSAVAKALEEQPLDFDSWPLVNSAASVYNSVELKRKCASYAEDKIDDFICEKDLEKYSADLICCMFDCSKMSSLNQDQVLKTICIWREGRSSSEIMSVGQKICWEKVSPKFTAMVLREFFTTTTKVGELKFWSKLSADIRKSSESNMLNVLFSKKESLVLKKGIVLKFALTNNAGTLYFRLNPDNIPEFSFAKENSQIEIPVKRLEFEASAKLNIQKITGLNLRIRPSNMVISEQTSSNGWFKYSAVFSDATPVFLIIISSDSFKNKSEISLQKLVIY